MIDAIWAVRFFAGKTLAAGAGVVAIFNNKLVGGDAQYYYKGKLDIGTSGTMHAAVFVRRHTSIPGFESIFGSIESFNLKLSGVIKDDEITLSGTMVENPGASITIVCNKVDTLDF